MEKTSIDRAFDILDLLDENRPTITSEEIIALLGFTRSTTYRYLKVLCGAGLLMQFARGSYTLGPRVVELERKIQISDPLLAAGRAVMPGHADRVPHSVLLLCGLWGERVLCLHQENAASTGEAEFTLSRARGLPFSLFKGAASLAILANLSTARIKSLYLRHGQEIAAAGLGDTWVDFRRRMLAIRKAGCSMTTGTFGSELTAVAAPVLNDEGAVLGSLTRIVRREHAESDAALIEGIKQAAAAFARHLNAEPTAAANQDDLSPAHRDARLLGSIVEPMEFAE